MCLVFPQHAGGTYRLIIGANGYAWPNVVFLEEERREDLIAGLPSKHE
jgi:hypothetical protein